MTHTPPIPEASVAPYPPVQAPVDKSPAPAPPKEEPRGSWNVDKRLVAGVAGIAVGSAAIAAALLFAGRNSRAKSATTPRHGSGTPVAHRVDATD